MGYMNIGHQKIVASYFSYVISTNGCTMDCYVFPYNISVADSDFCFLTFIFDILRGQAYRSKWIHHTVFTDFRILNDNMR